jgi:hypothetical protein
LLPMPPNSEALKKMEKLNDEFSQLEKYYHEQMNMVQQLVRDNPSMQIFAEIHLPSDTKRKRDGSDSFKDLTDQSKRKRDDSEANETSENSLERLERAREESEVLESLRKAEGVLRERILSPIEQEQDALRCSYKNHKLFEENLESLRSSVQRILLQDRSETVSEDDVERVKAIGTLWNKLWLQCKSYLNRLQAAEVVVCKVDFLRGEMREIQSGLHSNKDQLRQLARSHKSKLKEFRMLRRSFKVSTTVT